ncbi:hypothetical protein CDD83_5051 [Cordyceps sp. RAO-2017]|nr:hypothetical protein CDD83_5051 [Cordyceps sp. RAO-2017]
MPARLQSGFFLASAADDDAAVGMQLLDALEQAVGPGEEDVAGGDVDRLVHGRLGAEAAAVCIMGIQTGPAATALTRTPFLTGCPPASPPCSPACRCRRPVSRPSEMSARLPSTLPDGTHAPCCPSPPWPSTCSLVGFGDMSFSSPRAALSSELCVGCASLCHVSSAAPMLERWRSGSRWKLAILFVLFAADGFGGTRVDFSCQRAGARVPSYSRLRPRLPSPKSQPGVMISKSR